MNGRAVLERDELRAWLGRMRERARVMAPVKRGRVSFSFEWVEDPAEVELEYVRTVLPPKKALLPPREALLRFDIEGKQAPSAVIEEEPFVLFGVHPCDLAGLGQLSWAFTQRHGVADPHYQARREAATIVGLDCLPDEYCFCPSVGTCRSREEADVFLTPVEAGYLVEVLSAKGEDLLKGARGLRAPSQQEIEEAEAWPAEKERRTTCRIEAEVGELPELLESRYESELWEKTALRCYSCGSCTNVCPTCICFDVDDEVSFPLTTGTRWRTYDSCQFLDFALVAGPHNFRGERPDRVRHRWFRKFVYLNREHGRPFCVGCGRCTPACTAEIDLVGVLNEAIAEAKEGVG